ncbi:MAG: hypothetical protein AAF804_21885, partial [Bacteroidota bacterium]
LVAALEEVMEELPENCEVFIHSEGFKGLVGLLSQFKDLPPTPSPEFIKKIFDQGFTRKYYPPIQLLNYLKGIDRISYSWGLKQGDQYREIIQTLPEGKWVQYGSLMKSLKAELYFLFTDYFEGRNDLVQEGEEDALGSYRFRRETRLHHHFEERLFFRPAFHAATFTFAAWGLLDLAYHAGDDYALPYKIDSPLNRIVAIRLTSLGAYVLGKTSSYQSTIKPPFVLELATDSLSILLVEGDQDRAATAIQSFARPLGKQRFFSNANLFLNDCKSSEELTGKIKLFESIFPGTLPPNWKQFFEEMSQQVDPLQEEKAYLTFALNPSNLTLLQLVARDPELKSMSLKAEGYLLLVRKKDLPKFKARL